jgi:hypothetical protein
MNRASSDTVVHLQTSTLKCCGKLVNATYMEGETLGIEKLREVTYDDGGPLDNKLVVIL